MPAAWVVEAVDVLEDGRLRLSACLPGFPPDQFGLDCLEEGLEGNPPIFNGVQS